MAELRTYALDPASGKVKRKKGGSLVTLKQHREIVSAMEANFRNDLNALHARLDHMQLPQMRQAMHKVMDAAQEMHRASVFAAGIIDGVMKR